MRLTVADLSAKNSSRAVVLNTYYSCHCEVPDTPTTLICYIPSTVTTNARIEVSKASSDNESRTLNVCLRALTVAVTCAAFDTSAFNYS